jgi:hypothetical protein
MTEEREYAEVNGVIGEVLSPHTEDHKGVYVLPEGTRFEIYGSGGGKRLMTLKPGASIHIQDGGRTLKIFTNE